MLEHANQWLVQRADAESQAKEEFNEAFKGCSVIQPKSGYASLPPLKLSTTAYQLGRVTQNNQG